MENRLLKVYVKTEDVFGTVLKMGAFASVVNYQKDGIQYEELLENEDILFLGE